MLRVMKMGRFGAATFLLLSAHYSWAQVFPVIPDRNGGDEFRKNLPAPAPLPPVIDLPPLPVIPEEKERISPGFRLWVKSYRFSGNSIISTAELDAVAKSYTGRVVDSVQLQELRNKLTLYYVGKGYINSGAILPDQKVEGNVVEFRIVEGQLNEVNVSGLKRLKEQYIKSRLQRAAGSPFNVNGLQQSLLLLQQSPLIEKINAELSPGINPGESILNVAVAEARPYQLALDFSNHYSPSVGAYHAELSGSHQNLWGNGESADLTVGTTRGIEDYSFDYSMPVNSRDLRVGIKASKSNSLVVEAPFSAINIASSTQTTGVNLEYPWWKTPSESMIMGLGYEQRSSNTYLMGIPFSFSAGVQNGAVSENVLRFSQEWSRRDSLQVFSVRSVLSGGNNNALPKVNNIGPDQHFISWLGQGQWARRLKDSGGSVIFRLDMQYSPHSLLTMEKLGIGGAKTVRGYRETQLLRDNGLIASGEYRIPVFFNEAGESRTQFATFADYGKGWNTDHTASLPRDIASVGVGLLWNPDKHVQTELYLAQALRKFAISGNRDLQDSGVHFAASYQFF